MKYVNILGKQQLAPNGKKSKLTPAQYNIVRSAPFKSWFGDWTKARNHSVIMDSNGEPLVVYHGSKTKITSKFKFDHKFWNTGGGAVNGKGFYFTSDKKLAQQYEGKDGSVASVFLNIRKPLFSNATNVKGISKVKLLASVITEVIKIQEGNIKNYRDSFLSNFIHTYGNVTLSTCIDEVVSQILQNNSEILDYLFEIGEVCGSYNDVYRAMYNVTKHDGVIVKDSNVYIAWFPNQIKSVRNKTFNAAKEEIGAGIM